MICAIVLAAGKSRRMGEQKLLLPWGDKAMIAHIVDEVLCSAVDRVLVVVGCDGHRIGEALANRKVDFVINTAVEGDMLSSVRCGLNALPTNSRAAIVVLGDQPEITAELMEQLVRAFQKSGRGLIVPTYEGRRGHPLLFSMHYREEIFKNFDGVGLQGLLKAHAEDVFEVPAAQPGVLEDIDLPEDYQRLRDRVGKKRITG